MTRGNSTSTAAFALCEASVADGPAILEMLREIGPGENGFENSGHGLTEKQFSKWLQSRVDMAKGINLDPEHVPMTTYWLKRNGYPVGMSKLRIRLTKALLELGGHVGFCIRPSERGKGFANEILRQTVDAARKKGIDSILLTCDIDNEPSWHTIESCCGKLEKVANQHRYYWIDTSGGQQ